VPITPWRGAARVIRRVVGPSWRPGQAQALAQRGASVDRLDVPTALQFRDEVVHHVLETLFEIGEDQAEAVRGACLYPVDECSGHFVWRTDQEWPRGGPAIEPARVCACAPRIAGRAEQSDRGQCQGRSRQGRQTQALFARGGTVRG